MFPFYPDVQHEIDLMAYSGVLSISKVDYGPRGQVAAHYEAERYGLEIKASLIAADRTLAKVEHLFRELLFISFDRFLYRSVEINQMDANLGNDAVIEGKVVDFAEWADANLNLDVAQYLLSKLESLQPNSGRDGIRLYCDFLDEALAES